MARRWNAQRAADLPDGLILFDGVCVLCSWWVQFVIARDPPARYRFVPIQSAAGRILATRFGIDPDHPESNAAVLGGWAYFKSDAAIRVLSSLPGYRSIGVLNAVPPRWRDAAYNRIAGNRYRWFGRRETCLMPTPDIARRFRLDDLPGDLPSDRPVDVPAGTR